MLWLKQSQAGLTDEVKSLSRRVKALEQSHNQIIAMQSRAMKMQAASSANGESEVATADDWMQNGPKGCTPDEFSRRVYRMSAETLIQFAGKPDKQTTLGEAEYWTYSKLPSAGTNGTVESSTVQVVLENGRVDRATFSGNIQYGK